MSLIQHSTDRNLPYLIASWCFTLSANVRHYFILNVWSDFTSLCWYAGVFVLFVFCLVWFGWIWFGSWLLLFLLLLLLLFCGGGCFATLLTFRAEYKVWGSNWLKLFGWLAAKNAVLTGLTWSCLDEVLWKPHWGSWMPTPNWNPKPNRALSLLMKSDYRITMSNAMRTNLTSSLAVSGGSQDSGYNKPELFSPEKGVSVQPNPHTADPW